MPSRRDRALLVASLLGMLVILLWVAIVVPVNASDPDDRCKACSTARPEPTVVGITPRPEPTVVGLPPTPSVGRSVPLPDTDAEE